MVVVEGWREEGKKGRRGEGDYGVDLAVLIGRIGGV